MTHKMMTEEEAAEFKRGVRKSKKTPENSNAEEPAKAPPSTNTVQSTVSAAEIKAVLNETVWRVCNEMQPDLSQTDATRLNSDEFAYCIMLTMVCGAGVDMGRRRGFRMREAAAGDPAFCKDHN